MLEKCYEEGRQAAFDGFPRTTNPYPLHTNANTEWDRGWWDAKDGLGNFFTADDGLSD